jgi:hypothetical protein
VIRVPHFVCIILGDTPDPLTVETFEAPDAMVAADIAMQICAERPKAMAYELWHQGKRIVASPIFGKTNGATKGRPPLS